MTSQNPPICLDKIVKKIKTNDHSVVIDLVDDDDCQIIEIKKGRLTTNA